MAPFFSLRPSPKLVFKSDTIHVERIGTSTQASGDWLLSSILRLTPLRRGHTELRRQAEAIQT